MEFPKGWADSVHPFYLMSVKNKAISSSGRPDILVGRYQRGKNAPPTIAEHFS